MVGVATAAVFHGEPQQGNPDGQPGAGKTLGSAETRHNALNAVGNEGDNAVGISKANLGKLVRAATVSGLLGLGGVMVVAGPAHAGPILWFAGIGALGFLLLLGWDLFQLRSDLAAGRRSLDGLTLEAASEDGISAIALDASSHLTAADHRARTSVPLRVLSLVPGADQQVAGIRRLTAATADIGAVGARAAVRLDDRLQ